MIFNEGLVRFMEGLEVKEGSIVYKGHGVYMKVMLGS